MIEVIFEKPYEWGLVAKGTNLVIRVLEFSVLPAPSPEPPGRREAGG